METKILMHEAAINAELAQNLVKLANDIRKLTDLDLKTAVSTRLLIYAAKMINSGCSISKACKHCIIEPLTDEIETIKALERVVNAYF